jgi:aspartyl-tRNA(Asn)/glutamyl-tRNA(Gln) amidotransferase subunit A
LELYEYTVHELSDKLLSGEVTSEEIVKSYFDRIKEKDKDVKAYISLMEEEAIKKAREVDQRRKAGEKLGKYAGIQIRNKR